MLEHLSRLQAIYVFGSFGTEDQRPGSNVDVTVLLEPKLAKKAGSLAFGNTRFELESVLHKHVDLVNPRLVNTVMQKEVITRKRASNAAFDRSSDITPWRVMSLLKKII